MIKKNNNRPNVGKQQIKLSLGKISVEKDGLILSLNNGNDFYFEKTEVGLNSCLNEIEEFLSQYVEEEENDSKKKS